MSDVWTWTERGARWIGKELEGGEPLTVDAIRCAIDKMKFEDMREGLRLPAMVGMTLDGIVKDLAYKWRCVLQVGHSHELAPYGFLGLTYRYKDCDATSYWLDDGVSCTGIVSIKHAKRLGACEPRKEA